MAVLPGERAHEVRHLLGGDDAEALFERVEEALRGPAEGLGSGGVERRDDGGGPVAHVGGDAPLDALERGFEVLVLKDAVRGVDVQPGDSEKALSEMQQRGAKLVTLEEVPVP
ncbi:MAG: hypothetical protein ACK4N5_22625 [Myxococcales bacterium]